MSHHIDDGRVWAVDARTGQKRRVMPNVIPYSKHLSLAPSERARGKSVDKLTGRDRRTRRQQVTEPARDKGTDGPDTVTEPAEAPTDLEPDTDKPAEPEATPENKE